MKIEELKFQKIIISIIAIICLFQIIGIYYLNINDEWIYLTEYVVLFALGLDIGATKIKNYIAD